MSGVERPVSSRLVIDDSLTPARYSHFEKESQEEQKSSRLKSLTIQRQNDKHK